MSGKIYGYVRVSTRNQNEDRQMIAMREFGVEEKQIVVEKQSGKDFDRPLYRKLIKKLRPGDTLVVKSIDRLGRNYTEILEQWRFTSQEREVSIVVLDMPILNTQEDRELVWKLLSDLVLQVFSYVAENERENIRQRQAEGIAAAKARGVRFGRPRLTMPEEFDKMAALWQRQEISASEAARRLGVSCHTFLRRMGEREIKRTVPGTEKAKQHADGSDGPKRLQPIFLPAKPTSSLDSGGVLL